MFKKILKKIWDYTMKLMIFLMFALSILALVRPDLIKDWIEWLKQAIETLGYWNYAIVFLMWLVESFPLIWVVVPGQNILLIVWWFFAELSRENLYYVIALASVWAIISNYIGFVLWKIYWDSFFEKYWVWMWIWKTEVKYLKSWVKKWWPFWIIFWKFHNLLRAFVPFIAGSMWMSNKVFWISNIIGSIIRAATIVILWVVFAAYYETVIDYLWYIMTWILILTWIYIYMFKKEEFKKYMDEKNAELEAKINWK
jgi:membrane protein DedA with SNARE-associated domain